MGRTGESTLLRRTRSFALALGFPVAIVLAWAFDIREGKIERTKPTASLALKSVRLPLVLVGIGLGAAAPGII